MDRLADRLLEQDGRSITYRQGATTVVSGITAVPTDESYTVYDGEGGFTKIQSIDWIVKKTDLAGVTARPGDRIAETRVDEARMYEVMPIDKRPCCEDHDNAGVMVVLHTKRIE